MILPLLSSGNSGCILDITSLPDMCFADTLSDSRGRLFSLWVVYWAALKF